MVMIYFVPLPCKSFFVFVQNANVSKSQRFAGFLIVTYQEKQNGKLLILSCKRKFQCLPVWQVIFFFMQQRLAISDKYSFIF